MPLFPELHWDCYLISLTCVSLASWVALGLLVLYQKGWEETVVVILTIAALTVTVPVWFLFAGDIWTSASWFGRIANISLCTCLFGVLAAMSYVPLSVLIVDQVSTQS